MLNIFGLKMGVTQSGDIGDLQKKIPQLVIKSETWTKESHGLYDFDNTEVNQVSFALRGSHIINRTDSTVMVQPSENFEGTDTDQVIARALYKNNSYWLFHKNMIDDSND
jgi:hypothetical protein